MQKRADTGNELAFIDLVDGVYDVDDVQSPANVNYFYDLWKGVILKGGNYTEDKNDGWGKIVQDADANDRTLVGFGRHFIANPDLPERIKYGHDLNDYDTSTFYTTYNYGYNTYPEYGETREADPEEKIIPKPLIH